MTETNLKILELINNSKNMKQIAESLNISEKQLYVRIKQLINYGYNIVPSYSYNSDIYYNLKKDNNMNDKHRVNITMHKEDNLFRCLVISDTHIGCVDSDVKLLDIVYEYATKNGINNIFNCGDIIEGDYTSSSKSIKDIHSQLDYLLKKHPYDKNINNYVILGNHDHHSLRENGFDIAKTIKNSRYDIVPIGSGQGNVNIKNDSIILFHELYDGFKPIITNEKIVLSGHSHMMKTKLMDIFWLSIPTLSYKSNNHPVEVMPGFIDLSINFENNKIERVEAKHFVITPKPILVNEVRGKVKKLFNNN